MDKKLISKMISKNIFFLTFSIMTTATFMMYVTSALYTPQGMGALTINSVGYTLFQLTIDVTQGNHNQLHIINNFPLIPLFGGILYNIYILIKIYRIKGTSIVK